MVYIHTSQIALLYFVSPFVQFCVEMELHVYQACLATITVIDDCCDSSTVQNVTGPSVIVLQCRM